MTESDPFAADDLWVLVYISTAADLFSQSSLEALLARSRERNAAVGVTGMLAYHEGTFMQALEGPRGRVAEVYQRIERDPRHRSAIVLINKPIQQRQFGEWAMAYQRLADAPPPEGYHALLERGFTAETFREHPDHVHRLLQGFADRQHRRLPSL